MNFKLLGLMLFSIMLLGSVFALPPSVTMDAPFSVRDLVAGQTYLMDFNVVDYNAGIEPNPPQIKLYYSSTAGSYSNLIVWDTNLSNTTGVVCYPDQNFVTSRRCEYSWMPSVSIPTGTYWIDYNFIDTNVLGLHYYTGSSTRSFNIQLLPTGNATTGCGLIIWIVPLFGILLAFFVVMQLMAGKFSPALVTLSIGGVIGIVIVWGFGTAMCVI